MPCSECGHLLFVSLKYEDLRCPNCLDLDVEDEAVINEKIERDKDLLREDNQIQLVDNYDKSNLILSLIEHLNRISHEFYNSRRLDYRDFSYMNYLLKIVYSADKDQFDDDYLERDGGLDDRIEAAVDSQSRLLSALRHVEENFRVCLKYPVPQTNEKFLFGEYDIRDTEYRYGHWRCLKSLMGGEEEQKEVFDRASIAVRNFDTTEGDKIENLQEFADTFFEFIIALLFIASADDIVGDIYTTSLPSSVDVFDIKELLSRIDGRFTDEDNNFLLQDETLAVTTLEELNEAGEAVFDDLWPDVEDSIIIGEGNLDAHPFLFRVEVEDVIKQPSGRPPLTRETTRIVYPRHYAQILRYQIFPLLSNGEDPSGHDILSEVSKDRGLDFEEKVHEYLDSQGFDSYYSAEIPGVDSSEIDVLAVNRETEELWFIECKYLLPALRMETAEGMEELNGKFCHKVFNEKVDEWGDPTGRPFPEKVESWLSMESGANFRWKDTTADNEEVMVEFRNEWQNLDCRMFVVSNLTPTFVERDGVEFRTDVELVEMVEDEDPVFEVRN